MSYFGWSVENMDYGYKVCYTDQDEKTLKVQVVTNTYDLAEWNRKRYELRSPPSTTWLIIPINTRKEYLQRWKDCPF